MNRQARQGQARQGQARQARQGKRWIRASSPVARRVPEWLIVWLPPGTAGSRTFVVNEELRDGVAIGVVCAVRYHPRLFPSANETRCQQAHPRRASGPPTHAASRRRGHAGDTYAGGQYAGTQGTQGDREIAAAVRRVRRERTQGDREIAAETARLFSLFAAGSPATLGTLGGR